MDTFIQYGYRSSQWKPEKVKTSSRTIFPEVFLNDQSQVCESEFDLKKWHGNGLKHTTKHWANSVINRRLIMVLMGFAHLSYRCNPHCGYRSIRLPTKFSFTAPRFIGRVFFRRCESRLINVFDFLPLEIPTHHWVPLTVQARTCTVQSIIF